MISDKDQLSKFFGRLQKHNPDDEVTYLRIQYGDEAKKISEDCLAEHRENGNEEDINFWFEVVSILNQTQH